MAARKVRRHIRCRLRDPKGNVLTVVNLHNHCVKHKLHYSVMCQVIRGKVYEDRGWTCPDFDDKVWRFDKAKKKQRKVARKRGIPNSKYTLIDPNGHKVSVANLSQFAKEKGLDQSNLHKVARGIRFSYKGWTSPTYMVGT